MEGRRGVIDEGSRQADFTTYVAVRSEGLLRFATMLTGDRHDGEDLLQTCLAKAYLAWPRLSGLPGADAYVRRTLVTTNISRWRRRRYREVTTADVPERAAGPGGDTGQDVETRLLLWPQIRALPPRQRTVIVLRYVEDLTEAETARLMGCSIGTVKSYGARALGTLRSALASTGARTGGTSTGGASTGGASTGADGATSRKDR